MSLNTNAKIPLIIQQKSLHFFAKTALYSAINSQKLVYKKRVKGSKNLLTFFSKIVEDVGARISFAKVLSQMKKCRPKKIWPIFVKLVSMSSRRARS